MDGARDRSVLRRHHVGFGCARSRQYRPHAGAHGVRAKSRSDGRGAASQRRARYHKALVDLGNPPALHNMAGRQWCLAHKQRVRVSFAYFVLFERLAQMLTESFITFSFHLGKGRKIVDPQPNFHMSVQKRMASPLKYKPKAQWTAGTEVYLQ